MSAHKRSVSSMLQYVADDPDGYKMYPISSDTYTSKVCFKCPDGHEYMSTFRNFYDGTRCPKCWQLKKSKITKSKGLNTYFR
jgi:hypothetical protein